MSGVTVSQLHKSRTSSLASHQPSCLPSVAVATFPLLPVNILMPCKTKPRSLVYFQNTPSWPFKHKHTPRKMTLWKGHVKMMLELCSNSARICAFIHSHLWVWVCAYRQQVLSQEVGMRRGSGKCDLSPVRIIICLRDKTIIDYSLKHSLPRSLHKINIHWAPTIIQVLCFLLGVSMWRETVHVLK